MNPRHGEVWLVDMGMAAKTRRRSHRRPSQRPAHAHHPHSHHAAKSRQRIRSALVHLPFLDPESIANVQAIGSLPSARFEKRLGIVPETDLQKAKAALLNACALRNKL